MAGASGSNEDAARGELVKDPPEIAEAAGIASSSAGIKPAKESLESTEADSIASSIAGIQLGEVPPEMSGAGDVASGVTENEKPEDVPDKSGGGDARKTPNMDAVARAAYIKFWKLSDRTKRNSAEEQIPFKDLHNWGIITKAPERSPTLREMIHVSGPSLPENRNYTEVFKKIMVELDLKFSIIEMNLTAEYKKQHPKTKCMLIKTASAPIWAFEGFGESVDEAIEAASRKGVKFIVTVSCDKLIL